MTQKCTTIIRSRKETKNVGVKAHDICEVLLAIGIPPNLLGYTYITYATELILDNPKYMHAITKKLYVEIAKKYDSTPARVERDIRHAIKIGWLCGNMSFISHIFRYCVNPEKSVPSNSLFLSRLYYYFQKSA